MSVADQSLPGVARPQATPEAPCATATGGSRPGRCEARTRLLTLAVVALVVGALVGNADRLAAQYPNVPPPVPCQERGAEWDATLLDPIVSSRPPRVAVVPFRSSLSDADSANTAIAMAFAGRVVERLAPIHPVLVWTPSPGLDPPGTKEIIALGKANRVPYLLYGRLDPATHGITLTVRLFETAHGQLVWNPVLTGALTDLLGFEEVLVRGVTDRAGATPASSVRGSARTSGTVSTLGYLQYLRGVADLANDSRGSAEQANEEFQGAVRLDSAYAAAWAGFALSTVMQIQQEGLPSQNATSAATDVAVSAARRAIRLAPQSADVWIARGAVSELLEPREYTRALAAYRKAIDMSPWNAEAHRRLGQALIELGATDAGVEQFHLALSDERGDPATLVAIGRMHLRARRYHDACRALNAAVANEPRFAEAYAERAFVRLHLKDLRSAYGDAETGVRLGAWLTGTVAEVMADADSRDTASARQRIASLNADRPKGVDHPSVWVGRYLAEGYAVLGKDDHALELLTHATPRGATLWLALQDPSFDRLRGLVRYSTLVDDSHPIAAGP